MKAPMNSTARRVNPPARHKNPDVVKTAIAEIMTSATTGIVTAGIVFGMGETQAYQAAADGTIPTIQVGKRRRALCVPIREKLGLTGDPALAARVAA